MIWGQLKIITAVVSRMRGKFGLRSLLTILILVGFTEPIGAGVSPRYQPSLYELFEGKETRVFVEEIRDATGERKIDRDHLRSSLEKALGERKSILFEPVRDPASADILIEAEVTEYLWAEKDPVDMIMGVGVTLYDAVSEEHYCRMQATFTVKDAKTRELLWQDQLRATLTSRDLTEAGSVTAINEDMAKVFIKEAFAKKRQTRSR